MRYQVVVKLGDRVWDSIRDTPERALFRVCEHMKKDDPHVVHIASLAQTDLIFGKDIKLAVSNFEDAGFSIVIKEIGSA